MTVYTIQDRYSRKFYNKSRIFNATGDIFDVDAFFGNFSNYSSYTSSYHIKKFESIDAIASYFEARLMSIPSHLHLEETIAILNSILSYSKDLDIVEFHESYSTLDCKTTNVNFFSLLREIFLFQILNCAYGAEFARFYYEMKDKNTLKKYVCCLTSESEISELKSLLSDDVTFHEKFFIQPEGRHKIYLGLDNEEDINLIKLCCKNSKIVCDETKNIESLLIHEFLS